MEGISRLSLPFLAPYAKWYNKWAVIKHRVGKVSWWSEALKTERTPLSCHPQARGHVGSPWLSTLSLVFREKLVIHSQLINISENKLRMLKIYSFQMYQLCAHCNHF